MHEFYRIGPACQHPFIVLGYILSKVDPDKKIDADKTSVLVIAGTVLGGLIIVGFFFKHLFE